MSKISKKILVMALMVLSSLAIISCTENPTETQVTTEDPIEHTFDMDTVYYEGQGYEVTYKDLYQSIVINDGMEMLSEMIDRDLLSDYLSQVTTEQIDAKRTELIYGTTDQEKIDDIPEDNKEDMVESFNNGMVILGFMDDEDYLELQVARDLYIRDLLTNPDLNDGDYLITYEDVQDEYMNQKIGEVFTILIRYESLANANSALRSLNLVEYEGELRLYTDTETPLSELPSHRLNDTNTRTLTKTEVLEYFIQLYNDAYLGQRDPLSETASLEDLIALEDLTFEYDDLSEINSKLGNLLFSGLDTYSDDEEGIFYTYKPYEVRVSNKNNFYLALNLDRNFIDISNFEGDEASLITLIGQDIYDEILEDLIQEKLGDDTYVRRRLREYRQAQGFEILDYYLRLDYENVVPEDIEQTNYNKSDFVIAEFDGEEILVKDLMAYALERKAPLYLLHASQFDILMNTHFDNVYCDDEGVCERDFTQNNSGAMNVHLSDYQELETSFMNSQYADYYSFEDYLYLAYGAKNDVEMINSYVKRTLEPLFIYDYLMENKESVIQDMMTQIDKYYDNYFSLGVRHLLIHIDENGDNRPDDYEEYYEGLNDQAAFDTLLSDFQTEILTYLSDNGDDLADMVSTYQAAAKDDETWGQFKQAGLRLLTENLSSKESLTYMNSYTKYEESFVDGLVDVYQKYRLSENIDKDFIYNDELIETSYGLHLVQANKGDDFSLPSAEFTIPEDTELNYPQGLANENERLSASQVEVYFNYRIFDIVSNVVSLESIYDLEQPDLPEDLEKIMSVMLNNLYDAYFANAYLNLGMVEIVENGSLMDQSQYSYFTETEIQDMFNQLKDVYNYQVTSQYE